MSAQSIDNLSAVLAAAEALIRAANFGVRAQVPMVHGLLEWAKYGPVWELRVVRNETDSVPLLKANRHERVLAAGQLVALWTELQARAKAQEFEEEQATEHAMNFIRMVNGAGA